VKVLLVAPPWLPVPPPAYGGTELVLDGLARGLVDLGHDVVLFTTGDSTTTVPIAWTHETALSTMGFHHGAEMHHVLAAHEFAEQWGADVIHENTLAGPAIRTPRPMVATNHGPFEGDSEAIYRHVADRVSIIAISKAQAQTTDVQVGAVIHHGLDASAFPIGDGDGEYALFLGRMCHDKGIHTAIKVAQLAGVRLVIAAKMREPDEVRYFEEYVRPHLGPGVEFVGEVGFEGKQELLSHATCLLNPINWSEPFGMVMIEALACGTPVVATPWGAAPEIVEHGTTGYISNSIEALADSIGRVAALDRHRCRKAAESRFSIERMAIDHVRLYTSVLARSRPFERPA
jgi:glycosyltransferase involved in cell wall biosynthesis